MTASSCVHFKTGECGLCSKVCGAGAIDYEQEESTVELDVGAVLLTPGFRAFDASRSSNSVRHTIKTSSPMSSSNGCFPRRVPPRAMSADRRTARRRSVSRLSSASGRATQAADNDYCSSVCCMAATKEAILAKQHEPDTEVTVYYMDMRAYGKDFDRYFNRAKEMGVSYVRCRPSSVEEVNGQ